MIDISMTEEERGGQSDRVVQMEGQREGGTCNKTFLYYPLTIRHYRTKLSYRRTDSAASVKEMQSTSFTWRLEFCLSNALQNNVTTCVSMNFLSNVLNNQGM